MTLKRKLMLGMAAGLIAVVAVAGAALAQTPAPASGGDKFRDRVAQILGVERGKLDAAIRQAHTEADAAQLDTLLAQAVTAGRLTQAQAGEIKAWYTARPAAADKVAGLAKGPGHFGKGFGFDGGHGIGDRHGHGGRGRHGLHMPGAAPKADALKARLSALVATATLTQAEADAITAWVNARPAGLDGLKHTPRQAPAQQKGSNSGTTNQTALEAFFGVRA